MHAARITFALMALFAAAAGARAGELRLDNGALIPGEFARIEGLDAHGRSTAIRLEL